ncbi:blue copper protein-like [Impatiens glandulifera]|uniref:blue copper protein-like n=1 Tax=Impatiens glandulifera TaxID=253017 RepID=UPI001FB0C71C|nr:blue copper protein-like [Impatiens glandulifera]
MGKKSGFASILILVLCSIVPCLATVYTVGDSNGWGLGVDYTTWTSDKTFNVGDSLVFTYGGSHSVDEVKKSDYSSCSAANAITSDGSGSTTIELKKTGTHYFICGVSSHCSGGMKLSVDVNDASSTGNTTPPSTTTSPAPPTDDDGTTTTTPTPSTKVPNSSSSGSLLANPIVGAVVGLVIGWTQLLSR